MKMEEKIETISRYDARLFEYGYDPRTLGWLKKRQAVRFNALSQIGDLNGCSILDIGCGFGDLYGFLTNEGFEVDYLGVDINPNLVNIGREIYPEAQFRVMDVEEEPLNQKFDWVFASGLFNFKLSDNNSFSKNILYTMWNLAKKGIAADFLSSYVDFQEDSLHYSKPESIYSYCKSLSRKVVLRSDYMPFEFCVYVYIDDNINYRGVFTDYDRWDENYEFRK